MDRMSFTVARTNSLKVVTRFSISDVANPLYVQMMLTTGMSIFGNMSMGVVTAAPIPSSKISNANTTDGIEVDGTLKVDPTGGTLELTGSGELRLVGGTVTGVLGTEILDNDGNTIPGYGTIETLVLQNEGGGIVGSAVSLVMCLKVSGSMAKSTEYG